MIKMPDGIVTVHFNDERYRGAYYYRGDKLVVTAYGMKESSVDLAVLDGEQVLYVGLEARPRRGHFERFLLGGEPAARARQA